MQQFHVGIILGNFNQCLAPPPGIGQHMALSTLVTRLRGLRASLERTLLWRVPHLAFYGSAWYPRRLRRSPSRSRKRLPKYRPASQIPGRIKYRIRHQKSVHSWMGEALGQGPPPGRGNTPGRRLGIQAEMFSLRGSRAPRSWLFIGGECPNRDRPRSRTDASASSQGRMVSFLREEPCRMSMPAPPYKGLLAAYVKPNFPLTASQKPSEPVP